MLCAELSGTNCRAELSARNCPAPNCPRGIVLLRIVRAELSCADLSGHRSLSNWVTDLINPVVDIHCCGSLTVELPSPEVSAYVLFCSPHSSCRPTPFGLPQGSVLGPLLYILFTTEIGSLLAPCSLLSHSYADDVQAYKHCLASDAQSAILSVSRATGLLNELMSSNHLV